MITGSRPAHAVLKGIALAARMALPGAEAQTPPPTMDTGALGAAVEEARRSPFHSRAGAEWTVALPPGRRHPAHPLHTQPPRPSEEDAPDAWSAFPLTLLSVVVADLGGLRLLNDDGVPEMLGFAIPVLVPAAVLKLAGVSFPHGVLGSALGLGAGVLSGALLWGPAGGEVAFLSGLVAHATAATWISTLIAGSGR